MKYKETFNATINLEVNLEIESDTFGTFEFRNKDFSWYAAGGLWIKNKKITDYDGVFELPPFLLNKLNKCGYDTSEVE